MISATIVRSNEGLGRWGGLDWNALGDDVWAILTGLSTIGPLGTAVAAVIAAVALSQKWKADDRSAWWSRMQWAADHSLSKDDEIQLIGMEAIEAIGAGGIPSAADRALMEALSLRSKKEEMALGEAERDNGPRGTVATNGTEGGDHVDFPQT